MSENQRLQTGDWQQRHLDGNCSNAHSHGDPEYSDGGRSDSSETPPKPPKVTWKSSKSYVKHSRGSNKLLFPGNFFSPGVSIPSNHFATRPAPSSLPKDEGSWPWEDATASSSSHCYISSGSKSSSDWDLSRNTSNSYELCGPRFSSDMKVSYMPSQMSSNGKLVEGPNSMHQTTSSSSALKYVEASSRSMKHTESSSRSIKHMDSASRKLKYAQSALKWSKSGKSHKEDTHSGIVELLGTDPLDVEAKGKSHADYGSGSSHVSSRRGSVVYKSAHLNDSHRIRERRSSYHVGVPENCDESSSSACPWVSRSGASICQGGCNGVGASFGDDSENALLLEQCLITKDAFDAERTVQQHISQPYSMSYWHTPESSMPSGRDGNSVLGLVAEGQSDRSINRHLHEPNLVNLSNGSLCSYPDIQNPCQNLSIDFPGESSIRTVVPMSPSPCTESLVQGSSNGFSFSLPPPVPYGVVMPIPYQIMVPREARPSLHLSTDEFSFSHPPLTLFPYGNPSWGSSRSHNVGFHCGANPMQDLSYFREPERSSSVEYQHHLSVEGLSEILATLEHIEDFTYEQIAILEETILEGLGLHDHYRDMRLDVDNMSYEELLALEERIGIVSIGLSKEEMCKCVKLQKYALSAGTVNSILEDMDSKCSICQEEFEESQELGLLACGHHYHVTCIKQWLSEKNQCPICKSSAS